MPASLPQWLMFAFYTLGSAGGLVVLAILTVETIKGWRKRG